MMTDLQSTPKTKAERNSNIEDLLSERKNILDLPFRKAHVASSIEYSKRVSSITRSSNEKFSIGRISPCTIHRKLNDNSLRKILEKIVPSEGDLDDTEMNLLEIPIMEKSRKKVELCDIDRELNCDSISEIQEESKEITVKENSDDFVTVKSVDQSHRLEFEFENINLAEENNKLRKENKRIQKETQREINELKTQLEDAQDQLKEALKKLTDSKIV